MSTDFSRTPVDVVGLPSDVTELAPGADHTCVRTSTGKVFCWGSNSYGAIGIGSTAGYVLVPAEVNLL